MSIRRPGCASIVDAPNSGSPGTVRRCRTIYHICRVFSTESLHLSSLKKPYAPLQSTIPGNRLCEASTAVNAALHLSGQRQPCTDQEPLFTALLDRARWDCWQCQECGVSAYPVAFPVRFELFDLHRNRSGEHRQTHVSCRS